MSFMAVLQGKSLKAYIEQILIAKASSINIKVNENPFPSNDEWFNNPNNIEEIQESIVQQLSGETKAYSIENIKKALDV